MPRTAVYRDSLHFSISLAPSIAFRTWVSACSESVYAQTTQSVRSEYAPVVPPTMYIFIRLLVDEFDLVAVPSEDALEFLFSILIGYIGFIIGCICGSQGRRCMIAEAHPFRQQLEVLGINY